jgi:hypothetical protein
VWPELPRYSHEVDVKPDADDPTIAFSTDGSWVAFPHLPEAQAIETKTGRTGKQSSIDLAERSDGFRTVYAKELGYRSSLILKDRFWTTEIKGEYSDAAIIPRRSVVDVLLGRINVAAADSTGRTHVGYIAPPFPFLLVEVLVVVAIAVGIIVFRRSSVRAVLVTTGLLPRYRPLR